MLDSQNNANLVPENALFYFTQNNNNNNNNNLY